MVTSNFAFEVQTILSLESTYQDEGGIGWWVDCLNSWKYSQISSPKAAVGLSFAKIQRSQHCGHPDLDQSSF